MRQMSTMPLNVVSLLSRLGDLKKLHAWMIVLVWTALALCGLNLTLSEDVSLDNDLALPGTEESARASALIVSRLNGGAVSTTFFCNKPTPLLQSQQGQQRIGPTSGRRTFEVAGCVEDDTTELSPDTIGLLRSPVESSLVGSVDLAGTPRKTIADITAALSTFDQLLAGTPATSAPSDNPWLDQVKSETRQDLRRTELMGLALGAMLLLVILRSIVQASIALVTTGASILVALGATALLSKVMLVSVFTTSMVVMFGLAMSIDYSLLLIARYREEIGLGSTPQESWHRSIATAGRTIAIAGMAAACSLAGLILVPMTIVRSLAFGIVFAILISLLAALTLLPALIRLAGKRAAGKPMGAEQRSSAVTFRAISTLPVRHPGLSIAGVLLILAPLIAQLPGMTVGFVSIPAVSASTASMSPPQLEQRMIELSNQAYSVIEIAVEIPRTAETDAAISQLVSALGERDAFHPLVIVQWNEQRDLAVVSAILTGDSNALGTLDAVADLRDDVLPGIFGEEASTAVGGAPGAQFDSLYIISTWQWRIAIGVLVASLLFLLLTFQSITIAVKSVLMNVLSTCAALGALVGLFQHGWSPAKFGFEPTGSIEIWVPLVLFCVLFGLSTDYHLFLLSRIREHYGQTQNNRLSIESGLGQTSRLIAGASLIMAAVFATFAGSNVPGLQQLGMGLAIAVVLDATVIRAMLLPALMTTLGAWNWYLPRWLTWIPDLGFRAFSSPGK